MKVVSVCPTYARLPFLGRMLASFLSQNYNDKHLIIVNDDKNVNLICNYDNVTVVNIDSRLLIGEKRNIGLAKYGDIYIPWDDDDIYLPNFISQHVHKHKLHPNIGGYRNPICYLIYGDEFVIDRSSPNVASYKRDCMLRLGAYNIEKNSGEDAQIYNAFEKDNSLLIEEDIDNIDFVYQFGGVNYHLSLEDENQPLEETLTEKAKQQYAEYNITPKNKDFIIEPDFDSYQKMQKIVELFKTSKIPKLKILHKQMGIISIEELENL